MILEDLHARLGLTHACHRCPDQRGNTLDIPLIIAPACMALNLVFVTSTLGGPLLVVHLLQHSHILLLVLVEKLLGKAAFGTL